MKTLMAVLAFLVISSSSVLADEACKAVEVKEVDLNTRASLVKPLPIGNSFLIAEPTGLLKLFNAKGDTEKQVPLQDLISIAPFEMDGKIVVVGNKKVHIFRSKSLDQKSSVDLGGDALSAGEFGSGFFGIALRSGNVNAYDGNGTKKFEATGIRPNQNFRSYFSIGGELLVVGEYSIKYVKDDKDITFKSLLTSGASHGNQLAVGDANGQVHILDVGKKKTKTYSLGGGAKNIISFSGGFIVYASDGKLYSVRGSEPKPISEILFSGLYRNVDSGQTFAFSSNGDVYQVVDGSLSKTKLKGSYDSIYSWGKDFVTFNAGSFQVLGDDGAILEQRNYEVSKSMGLNQVQKNMFVAAALPVKTITLAKNTKCQK